MPDTSRMRNERPALFLALTSHGLGHVIRSLAIIAALHETLPDLDLVVSSTIDAEWIRQQLGFDVECRRQAYEPGAIQQNCFEADVTATLAAYVDFGKRRGRIVKRADLAAEGLA